MKDYKTYRQKIDKTIFHKTDDRPINFGQINIELEPEDIISAGYEEPYYGSDSNHDGYYYLSITRVDWESEKQFNKRMEQAEWDAKWAKERRLAQYEKLKKEFENNGR